MSLIRDYLKKTEPQVKQPSKDSVPPVMRRNSEKEKQKGPSKGVLILINIVAICVIIFTIVNTFFPRTISFSKISKTLAQIPTSVISLFSEDPSSLSKAPTASSATAKQQTSQKAHQPPLENTPNGDVKHPDNTKDSTLIPSADTIASNGSSFENTSRKDGLKDIREDQTSSLRTTKRNLKTFPENIDDQSIQQLLDAVATFQKNETINNQNGAPQISGRSSHRNKLDKKTASPGLNQKKHEAYFNLALSAHQAGATNRAIHYYLKAVEEKPDLIKARINLAALYIETNQTQKGRASLEQVLLKDPKNTDAMVNMAILYMKQGLHDQAEKMLLRALQLNENSYIVLSNLAYLNQKQNRLDQALTYYRKLIDIDPDNAKALLGAAHILEIKNRFRASLSYYQQSLGTSEVSRSQHYTDRVVRRIKRLQYHLTQSANGGA